jgi:dihydrofolate reductase
VIQVLPVAIANSRLIAFNKNRDRVDWNAELVRGDLGKAVQQLKRESGKGLLVGGVKLPLALAELGLIDEYEFVVQPNTTLADFERRGIPKSVFL